MASEDQKQERLYQKSPIPQKMQLWNDRQSDKHTKMSLQGIDRLSDDELSKAFETQLTPYEDGTIRSAYGPGPGFLSAYSLSAFSQAMAAAFGSTKMLFSHCTDHNQESAITFACTVSVGNNARLINYPAPLSYLSYNVSTGDYDFGIYVRALDDSHADVIVLDSFGTQLNGEALQAVDYVNKPMYGSRLDAGITVGNKAANMYNLDANYVLALRNTLMPGCHDLNQATNLEFIHCPLFGSTTRIFLMAVKELGFKKIDRMAYTLGHPIPSFERHKAELDAMKVLAKDYPDGRMIIVHNDDGSLIFITQKVGDQWVDFTFAEISQLLLWWLHNVYQYQKQYKSKKEPSLVVKKPVVYILDIGQDMQHIQKYCQKEGIGLQYFGSPTDVSDKVNTEVRERAQQVINDPNFPSGDNQSQPFPLLMAIGEDRFMCDPEFIPV